MNRNATGLLLLTMVLSWSAINSSVRGAGGPGRAASPEKQAAPGGIAMLSALHTSIAGDYRSELCNAIAALPISQEGPATQGAQPACDLQAQLQRADLDVLLATVPDPKHTRLTLMTDRQMDAILQGAQAAGFGFSSASLPWDAKDYADSPDPIVRFNAGKLEEFREENPGYIAFRDLSGAREHHNALLLVIGERPTSGADPAQFKAALEMFLIHAQKLGGADGRPGAPTLSLIGPTFSGSLPYLRGLLAPAIDLARQRPSRLSINVVSGSISSYAQSQTFENQLKLSAKKQDDPIHFFSMQESDSVIGDLLLDQYFHNESGEGIALLTEEGTSFGNVSRNGEKQLHAKLLPLYFPREISQLRTAYQKGVLDQPQQITSTTSVPRSTLKLSLEQSGSDDDAIPNYSPQYSSSQESVMLGIVASLRTHRIRTVILRASDPLDVVFLTEYLRTAYPDIQVVTGDNDWFLPHEAGDAKLRGVLSVSAYPLTSSWQQEMAGGEEGESGERVFPSGIAAGTFNASRLVFGQGLEGDRIKAGAGLFEYVCPTDFDGCKSAGGQRPPVMVETVTRSGYSPVALLSQQECKTCRRSSLPFAAATSHAFAARQVPLSWMVFVLVALFGALFYALLLLAGFTRVRSQLVFKLRPVVNGAHASSFFVNALVIAGVVLLSWIPSGYLLCTHPSGWVMVAIAAVLGAASLAGIAIDLEERQPGLCWRFLLTVGVAIAIVLALVQYGSSGALMSQRSAWRFFFERYVQLTSQVSPLLPFLLLALALLWWLSQGILGMALLGNLRPHIPHSPPVGAGHSCASFSEFAFLHPDVAEKPKNLLQPVFWYAPLHGPMAFAIAVVLVFMVTMQGRPLLSVESARYDWIFFLLFLMVSAVCFSEIGRLWLMWKQFQRFLLSLDNTRLRRGFSNLKGLRWDPVWSFGGEFNDLWKLLVRMYEALACITARGAKDGLSGDNIIELNQKLSKASEELQAIRDAYAPEKPPVGNFLLDKAGRALMRSSSGKLCDVSELFRQCAETLLKMLQQNWQKETSFINDDLLDQPKEKVEGRDELTIEVEQFVCLVYLNVILALFSRLRSVATALAGLYIFLLLACHIYPFASRAALDAFLVVLLGIIAVMVGMVYAQMHRNPTMSRITNTEVGKVGGVFWLRMLSLLALPIVSLLAAQFPGFASFLFSWLEPAANALH